MDDDVGLDLLKYGGQLGGIGDVGLEVLEPLRLGAAVAHAPQIEGRHGAVVVVEQEVDDVVA